MKLLPKSLAAFYLLCASAWGVAAPPPAEVGTVLPQFSLADQQGKAHNLDDEVRRIYFNTDRKGDHLLKSALQDNGQALLDRQHAIVLSDISAVPSFIKGFVISDLKDRHYTTWLDQDGASAAPLPRQANQVTVIDLDQRRVKAVHYTGTLDALKQDLGS